MTKAIAILVALVAACTHGLDLDQLENELKQSPLVAIDEGKECSIKISLIISFQ